jgi:hypothetical protein
MTTTYRYPRGACGNPRRPFQLVTEAGLFLSRRSSDPHVGELASIVNMLRDGLSDMLPAGCPFVIGGGLIRDAILGGRPGDIDIWFPANIRIRDPERFLEHILLELQPRRCSIAFNGPPNEDLTPGATQSNYGDVNNHWVMEVDLGVAFPKVNIMCSMSVWFGDAQGFFTDLMQAFDLDMCMFFCAWMPGDPIDTRVVIMPDHLWRLWSGSDSYNPAMGRLTQNSLHYNAARANTTSEARIQSRIDKMCSKYCYSWRQSSRIDVIPQDEILAVPVSLRAVMSRVNRNSGPPYPTMANSNHEDIHNGAARAFLQTQGQELTWN